MLKITLLSALAFSAALALAPSRSEVQAFGPPASAQTSTVRATATATPALTPTPTAAPLDPIAAAGKDLLKAINLDRAKRHLPPLLLDKKQSKCSLKHSQHMAALGMATHDGFPADICAPHSAAGENVGFASGQSSPQTAVLMLHRMMMAEGPCPLATCSGLQFEQHGHYLNLTSAYFTGVGIGILIRDGGVWLTEDFLGHGP